MLKRIVTACAAVGVLAGLAGGSPAEAQRTKVTLYTAFENDQLAPAKKLIEEAVPDVEVDWVRDSTGVITARFLAEKDNPKADMVMGLAASSLLLFKKSGLLEPYAPKGIEALKPLFRDSANPPAWVGQDAFIGVICYNTAEGQKANAKVPASWKDLTDPAFNGKIVMPHPASSGTGYLNVAMWLQSMGEAEGWKFMDALHQNIGVYTHSGSAPCVQAAKGERTVGIGFDMRGAKEKTAGAPLEVIVPAEGAGWEMEAFALVKGSKNSAAAKKIADWAVSKSANEWYSTFYAVVAHPDVKNLPPNYPKDGEARMFKVDFQRMADDRERILAEWSKRYESKAAPKN